MDHLECSRLGEGRAAVASEAFRGRCVPSKLASTTSRSHGSDTRHLFIRDDGRKDFLERLGFTFWQRGLELLAYVLLGNHYHALVQVPDALSEALQRLHTEYSRNHNRVHGRRAHLFRAHCLARRISDDRQLLTA